MRGARGSTAVVGLLAIVTMCRAQQPPATPGACKVCVVEPKKNTKTVYGSVCKEYCLPRCSLWETIRGWCGGCSSCGECGPVRTRNVLTKKTVPACDTKQCVIKEAEACPPKTP
jgi:hypothetical protein